MTAKVISHLKNWDGMIDVDLLIDKKVYHFVINSEFHLRQILQLQRKRKYGQVVNYLKAINRKEEGEYGQNRRDQKENDWSDKQ